MLTLIYFARDEGWTDEWEQQAQEDEAFGIDYSADYELAR